MGEYGRIVGETSGSVGGGGSSAGGGSADLGGDAMSALSGLLDQVAALPVEVMVVIAAVVMVGGIAMSLRPS